MEVMPFACGRDSACNRNLKISYGNCLEGMTQVHGRPWTTGFWLVVIPFLYAVFYSRQQVFSDLYLCGLQPLQPVLLCPKANCGFEDKSFQERKAERMSVRNKSSRSRQTRGYERMGVPSGWLPDKGTSYRKGGASPCRQYHSRFTGINAAALPRKSGRRI